MTKNANKKEQSTASKVGTVAKHALGGAAAGSLAVNVTGGVKARKEMVRNLGGVDAYAAKQKAHYHMLKTRAKYKSLKGVSPKKSAYSSALKVAQNSTKAFSKKYGTKGALAGALIGGGIPAAYYSVSSMKKSASCSELVERAMKTRTGHSSKKKGLPIEKTSILEKRATSMSNIYLEKIAEELEKEAGQTGAAVGGALAGWPGAAIGADKGKRLQSAGGALGGALAGGAISNAVLRGAKNPRAKLAASLVSSMVGSSAGAAAAHGKSDKKKGQEKKASVECNPYLEKIAEKLG